MPSTRSIAVAHEATFSDSASATQAGAITFGATEAHGAIAAMPRPVVARQGLANPKRASTACAGGDAT